MGDVDVENDLGVHDVLDDGFQDGEYEVHTADGGIAEVHDESGVEDPELEAIKARVREMEEEAEKLKELQTEAEKEMNLSSSSLTSQVSIEEKIDTDLRSVYVGNVDYSSTAEELEQHFHGCGGINRVTILCDKFTGHPKGFAYIEFSDKDSVQTAQALDQSLFKGRQIKVNPKRTNRPGISTTNRGAPRGGRFRRGFTRPQYYYGGGGGGGRSRARYRPRRAAWYSPY